MSVDARAQAVERITAAERPQARRTLRRDGVTFHIERAQINDAGRSAEVLDLRSWVGPAARQHSSGSPPVLLLGRGAVPPGSLGAPIYPRDPSLPQVGIRDLRKRRPHLPGSDSAPSSTERTIYPARSDAAMPSSRSPSIVSRPGTARHQPTFAQIEPSGRIWPHVVPPRDATSLPRCHSAAPMYRLP